MNVFEIRQDSSYSDDEDAEPMIWCCSRDAAQTFLKYIDIEYGCIIMLEICEVNYDPGIHMPVNYVYV